MANGNPHWLEVAQRFHQLGWTSFGGPAAHIGYFREAFVQRRRWLDETAFAELLALVQLLPGPSSTQLAILLGIGRAGLVGGLLAFLGFTLPSALLMLGFGLAIDQVAMLTTGGWLHGLKVVVAGVVAQAIWSMGARLCPDWPTRAIAALAALCALVLTGPPSQLLAIALGGVFGWLSSRERADAPPENPAFDRVGRRTGVICLSCFFILLIGLPALRVADAGPLIALVDAFYRPGALVFGGGHVILPLLQAEVVDAGWLDPARFLAGYGAAQAVPGPLFTFAAYLGAVMTTPFPPIVAGVIALVALFLPSALLLLGVLPFWASLRQLPGMAGVLTGVGAAVVGLLIAVWFDPILPSALLGITDAVLAALVFLLLASGRLPPWVIVIACAAIRAALPLA